KSANCKPARATVRGVMNRDRGFGARKTVTVRAADRNVMPTIARRGSPVPERQYRANIGNRLPIAAVTNIPAEAAVLLSAGLPDTPRPHLCNATPAASTTKKSSWSAPYGINPPPSTESGDAPEGRGAAVTRAMYPKDVVWTHS